MKAHGYAGLTVRLAIDVLLVVSMSTWTGFIGKVGANFHIPLVAVIILMLLAIPLRIYLIHKFGCSVEHFVLNVRVVTENGHKMSLSLTVKRELLYVGYALIGGTTMNFVQNLFGQHFFIVLLLQLLYLFPYLSILWMPKKQTLFDVLTKTVVTSINPHYTVSHYPLEFPTSAV